MKRSRSTIDNKDENNLEQPKKIRKTEDGKNEKEVETKKDEKEVETKECDYCDDPAKTEDKCSDCDETGHYCEEHRINNMGECESCNQKFCSYCSEIKCCFTCSQDHCEECFGDGIECAFCVMSECEDCFDDREKGDDHWCVANSEESDHDITLCKHCVDKVIFRYDKVSDLLKNGKYIDAERLVKKTM